MIPESWRVEYRVPRGAKPDAAGPVPVDCVRFFARLVDPRSCQT